MTQVQIELQELNAKLDSTSRGGGGAVGGVGELVEDADEEEEAEVQRRIVRSRNEFCKLLDLFRLRQASSVGNDTDTLKVGPHPDRSQWQAAAGPTSATAVVGEQTRYPAPIDGNGHM